MVSSTVLPVQHSKLEKFSEEPISLEKLENDEMQLEAVQVAAQKGRDDGKEVNEAVKKYKAKDIAGVRRTK